MKTLEDRHSNLLPQLALKPQMRLHLECNPRISHAFCQGMELTFLEGKAKMWNRNRIPIHRIEGSSGMVVFYQVSHCLMSIQIEIYPSLR